jgi:hypothetical protein
MINGATLLAVLAALFGPSFFLLGAIYMIFGPHSFKKRVKGGLALFGMATILGICYWFLTH